MTLGGRERGLVMEVYREGGTGHTHSHLQLELCLVLVGEMERVMG